MIKLDNITPYTNIAADSAQTGKLVNSGDVKEAARRVEEIFLNELLKTMFQNTELSKEKGISDYLPVFTMEMSKSISKRSIGLQDFLMRSPAFKITVEKGMGRKAEAASTDSGAAFGKPNGNMNIRAYEEIMQ